MMTLWLEGIEGWRVEFLGVSEVVEGMREGWHWAEMAFRRTGAIDLLLSGITQRCCGIS